MGSTYAEGMRREVVTATRRRLAAGWVMLLLLVPTAMICHALLAGGHPGHASVTGGGTAPAHRHSSTTVMQGMPATESAPDAGALGQLGPSHAMTLVAVAVTALLLIGFGASGRSIRSRRASLFGRTRLQAVASRAPPLVVFTSLLCVSRT